MAAMSSATEPTTPRLLQPIRPLVVRTTDGEHRPATWLELFFDLCFVVAIAALARALHADPTWQGAAIFVGLFVPVWWAWMGYTWFADTFDNDDVPYRASFFGAMLAVIWLASSVESAAEGNGFAFALAYSVLQALLLGLIVRARRDCTRHVNPRTHAPMEAFLNRYIVFNAVGLVPWLVSLGLDGPARYALWAVGLLVEVIAPYAAIRIVHLSEGWHLDRDHIHRAAASYGVSHESAPGLPATDLFHLDHIRERYGLFSILVLGESILAVSVGVVEVGWDVASMLTASLMFLAAVSMWWTYFDRSGRDALSAGLLTSFVWGYAHFAIFAGIAAVGVGTELLIESAAAGHEALVAAVEGGAGAGGGGGLPGSAIVAGGVAGFWLGMTIVNLANLGFRLPRGGRLFILMRLAVAGALVILALAGDVGPLPFAAVAGALMVTLNAFETARVMRLQHERFGKEVAT